MKILSFLDMSLCMFVRKELKKETESVRNICPRSHLRFWVAALVSLISGLFVFICCIFISQWFATALYLHILKHSRRLSSNVRNIYT